MRRDLASTRALAARSPSRSADNSPDPKINAGSDVGTSRPRARSLRTSNLSPKHLGGIRIEVDGDREHVADPEPIRQARGAAANGRANPDRALAPEGSSPRTPPRALRFGSWAS